MRAFLRTLSGPRFIDGPIRTIALVLCLSGLMPGAAETDAPGYVVLLFLSCILTVVAAVAPRVGAAGAAAGFLLFLAVYPEYLNPFQESIEFAAAVLLSAWKWRWSLAVTASAFALTGVAMLVQPELATPFPQLGFSWVLNSVIGLSAAFAESRIQRELVRRERAAREHERSVQQLRLGFAVDTHDIVSHGLATQAAMIRIISAEPDPAEAHRKLGELAVANGTSQEQLRVLLGRLTSPPGTAHRPPLTGPGLRAAVEPMLAAAESGGFPIALTIGAGISPIPDARVDHVLSIARELVTNIVKHASNTAGCRLEVRESIGPMGRSLSLSSVNPTETPVEPAPRSLTVRAEELGGSCRVTHRRGSVEVRVSIPT